MGPFKGVPVCGVSSYRLIVDNVTCVAMVCGVGCSAWGTSKQLWWGSNVSSVGRLRVPMALATSLSTTLEM